MQDIFRNQENEADAKIGGIVTGGKTDNESKRWRELGNQAFKAGKDRKALQMYNEAVVYAPQRKNALLREKKVIIERHFRIISKLAWERYFNLTFLVSYIRV